MGPLAAMNRLSPPARRRAGLAALALCVAAVLPFARALAPAAAVNAVPGGGALDHMLGQPQAGGHVTGSAFAVAPGLVVTNAHVTMRCRAAGLPLMVDGAGGWQLRAEEPASELALLSGPADAPALRLSAAPRLPRGAPVALLGYPQSGGERLRAGTGAVRRAALTVHRPEAGRSVSFVAARPDGAEVETGWADGVAYFGADQAERLRWILEIEAPADHGDSGGPLLDGDGDVVGVVFAGNAASGTVSAVTLDDLRDFLLRAGVTPGFAPPAERISPDWQRALDRAAPSVLRVGC